MVLDSFRGALQGAKWDGHISYSRLGFITEVEVSSIAKVSTGSPQTKCSGMVANPDALEHLEQGVSTPILVRKVTGLEVVLSLVLVVLLAPLISSASC